MKDNKVKITNSYVSHSNSIDFEVSGCVLIHENKFLVLQRNPQKPYGGTWCLPAGKKEAQESPIETLIRETKEEIGVCLKNQRLEKIGSFHIDIGSSCFLFHVYFHITEVKPQLEINTVEHTNHDWISFDELEKHDLIISGREVLNYCKTFLLKRFFFES
ncbi:MAG: NUDIX hydrolase [Chlamydiae bacterium]|nr:NUDIX hydrolase [Chlamydiota bacterium]